ncbi:hypothetical protein AVEN_36265-1 [Araneus ventricosus]|uniref:Uncharacterized protein n=1 Tax=Araneus ventricosus TaxID=182803 RepID=A0A4Y2NZ31_ARAVE|nr:hypothetical protein AVEN_36265-1 [Araneus ventricosus]
MVRLLVVDATTLFMLLFLFYWGLSNDSTFRLSRPSWVMEWNSITFSLRRGELSFSFNVIHVSSHTYSVYDDQVAVSPNVIPELIYSPQNPAPAPSTIEAILITRGIGRQPATPADTRAYSVTGVPASRYIPGYPYGSPVIYGYSFGP